jgi:hypothetical protein
MEVLVIFLVVAAVLLLHRPVYLFANQLYTRVQWRKFIEKETFYHSVVSRYFKYYNRLGLAEQRKFLFRTYLFRKSRRFHYIEVRESPEMPILISAAAVQLTFGLDAFMLNYFNDIFVLKDDYHYGFYSRPFMGHVDQTGIYLSWDNFMRGICGQTPNCNVGLHEMGHALAYVNFITETDQDKHFKKEFKSFSKIARPIFGEMQQGKKNILGDYASTNYHEFWAVAVETFFENPVRFKHELPELYMAMAQLLNQDPLNFVAGKTTIIIRSSTHSKSKQFA